MRSRRRRPASRQTRAPAAACAVEARGCMRAYRRAAPNAPPAQPFGIGAASRSGGGRAAGARAYPATCYVAPHAARRARTRRERAARCPTHFSHRRGGGGRPAPTNPQATAMVATAGGSTGAAASPAPRGPGVCQASGTCPTRARPALARPLPTRPREHPAQSSATVRRGLGFRDFDVGSCSSGSPPSNAACMGPSGWREWAAGARPSGKQAS